LEFSHDPDPMGCLHYLRTMGPVDARGGRLEEAVMMMNVRIYVRTVLELYLQMPGTPSRICPNDRALARQWFARQIRIDIVEMALLLGTARRIYRPPDALRLAPIRSMAYFAPVVEELVDQPPPTTYIHYLRYKLGLTASMDAG
jgi:hypothetical protein